MFNLLTTTYLKESSSWSFSLSLLFSDQSSFLSLSCPSQSSFQRAGGPALIDLLATGSLFLRLVASKRSSLIFYEEQYEKRWGRERGTRAITRWNISASFPCKLSSPKIVKSLLHEILEAHIHGYFRRTSEERKLISSALSLVSHVIPLSPWQSNN